MLTSIWPQAEQLHGEAKRDRLGSFLKPGTVRPTLPCLGAGSNSGRQSSIRPIYEPFGGYDADRRGAHLAVRASVSGSDADQIRAQPTAGARIVPAVKLFLKLTIIIEPHAREKEETIPH
jgi:hypothetical protein